jgi:hypothetical protein
MGAAIPVAHQLRVTSAVQPAALWEHPHIGITVLVVVVVVLVGGIMVV